MKSIRKPSIRQCNQGFSLIELMISMTLGLVVMAALFTVYLNSALSNRASAANTQIIEDAALGLNMLRAQISQTGYARPTAVSLTNANLFAKTYTARSLFGCDGTFTDTSAAITALACNNSGSDAIAVAFEADSTNSPTSGGAPLDCLGNSLTQITGTNPYYLAYSRFYVGSGSLYCRGPGSNTPQVLVENVQDLQIEYGVSASPGTTSTRVAYYASAGSVTNWDNVVAVRICLILKSADPVLDSVTSYQGCNPFATATTPGDKRLYRAFTTTIALPNRMGGTL